MTRYDYYIAGRWRNRDKVNEVRDALRAAGKTVYCFTDNEYDGDGIKFQAHAEANPEAMMQTAESLVDWQTNPTFRKIFENDMAGLKASNAYIMVLPAGLSAHMELGVAYGMGKPCYGIGAVEKVETLYLMFNRIFPDVSAMVEALA